METILIPIDFSEVSKSAAEYAFQFAKERNASLILLHVFQIPVYSGNDPVFMPPFDELENRDLSEQNKELSKQTKELYNYNLKLDERINKLEQKIIYMT